MSETNFSMPMSEFDFFYYFESFTVSRADLLVEIEVLL